MVLESILRLNIIDYFLIYLVKNEDFYLRSTEFVIKICVPNLNEIWRLEQKLLKKSSYFFNDPRTQSTYTGILNDCLLQFNPSSPLSPETLGFVRNPELGAMIHCVAFVVDGSTVDVIPEKILRQIKVLQTKMNQRSMAIMVIIIYSTRHSFWYSLMLFFSIPMLALLSYSDADYHHADPDWK